MLPSNSLQDEMLRNYIENVFNKYDTDKNGSLDVTEMTQFFNDLFANLKIGVVVTQAQSLEAIRSIDENSDGMVDRQELFKAFKLMLNPPTNQSQRPMQNTSTGYPPPQNYPPNQGYNNMNHTYGNNQGYGPQGYNSYNQGYNGGYGGNPGYGGQGYNQGYPPQNQGYMNNTQGYNPPPPQGYNNGQMYGSQGRIPPNNNNFGNPYSNNPYR